MPDNWEKGFKIAAAALCILIVLPLVQMVFRKLPLDEINPVVLAETATVGSRISSTTTQLKNAPLPPIIEKRSAKLEKSGILGRTPKPPPMALIGIADPYAFLQTPDGQTGKIKEGETLRGVKVLRVGANRVLVEHDGRTSELSIFSGIGSQSLLPKNPR